MFKLAKKIEFLFSNLFRNTGEVQPVLKSNNEQTKALKYMSQIVKRRPLDISIETISVCNSRCKFCAYPKSDRKTEIMSIDLFDKICREYAALGGGSIGFGPVMGDPLVDPLLIKRIRLVKSKYENLRLHTFTNGILFSKFSDSELLEFLKAMEIINISLGGLEAEDYITMFGVDKFDDVWQALCRIYQVIKKHNLDTKVFLHFRTFNREKIIYHPKYDELQKMGFDCKDVATCFSDWGGIVTQADLPNGAVVSTNDNTFVTSPCIITFTEFTVLPNGEVPVCGCMDGKLQYIMGAFL